MLFRSLSPDFAVAAQIGIDDVSVLAAKGFKTVICNRPDGEDQGQPTANDVQMVVEAVGMNWCHIPVFGHVGITADNVVKLRAAMERFEGPYFAYCRSGTRSAYLYEAAKTGL